MAALSSLIGAIVDFIANFNFDSFLGELISFILGLFN